MSLRDNGTTQHVAPRPTAVAKRRWVLVAKRRWKLARHASAWNASPPNSNSSWRDDGNRHQTSPQIFNIRDHVRRPYRTDKFLQATTRHWRVWLISDVPPGQRDNPTRRPTTDGSREATMGFSREATLEISQARECLERVPPNSNSSWRDDGNRHYEFSISARESTVPPRRINSFRTPPDTGVSG